MNLLLKVVFVMKSNETKHFLFHGGKNQFPCGKNQFFLLYQAQIYALATSARVTLSFDWLAFAVKLVVLGSWTIAQGTRTIFQIQLSTKTSFTANANQSNESVTRARVASADICA